MNSGLNFYDQLVSFGRWRHQKYCCPSSEVERLLKKISRPVRYVQWNWNLIMRSVYYSEWKCTKSKNSFYRSLAKALYIWGLKNDWSSFHSINILFESVLYVVNKLRLLSSFQFLGRVYVWKLRICVLGFTFRWFVRDSYSRLFSSADDRIKGFYLDFPPPGKRLNTFLTVCLIIPEPGFWVDPYALPAKGSSVCIYI